MHYSGDRTKGGGKGKQYGESTYKPTSEGHDQQQKIHVADMRKHASDMGAYMWHRYNSLMESAKYVVSEMERLDEKVDKRETLEIRTAKRKIKSVKRSEQKEQTSQNRE